MHTNSCKYYKLYVIIFNLRQLCQRESISYQTGIRYPPPLLNPFTSAAARIRKFVSSGREKVSRNTENLNILLPDCVNMFAISEQSQRCVNLNTQVYLPIVSYQYKKEKLFISSNNFFSCYLRGLIFQAVRLFQRSDN